MGATPAHWFAVADRIELSELAFSVYEDGKWIPADVYEIARLNAKHPAVA